jgi:LPXTG-motif cell wall-anchored protein
MSALILVIGVISAPNAMAQIAETSFLRVTDPLDVGGYLLEPGTYVIRVLPGYTNRNLLQITNEDRTKIFATVLSIPHAYPVGVGEANTEYVLYPAVEGTPRALRTWYAVNSTSKGGHDIVYPERRAMELAPVVKEPVIAYKGEAKPEELATVPLVIVTPKKEVVVYVEPTPAPKPELVAKNELPKTASNLPLAAAIGLLLIGAAVVIRVGRVA